LYTEEKTRTWNTSTGFDGILLEQEFNRIYDILANFIVGNAGLQNPMTMEEIYAAQIPVGCVVTYLPCYFANGSNGTPSTVSISLTDNYKLCDGSAVNDSDSAIFNGAGRYLPNITDDRFLMGSTSLGDIGGGEGHYHGKGTANVASSGAHQHNFTLYIPTGATQRGGILFSNKDLYAYTRTTASSTHTHPIGEFSGNIGTGSVNGNTAEAVKPKYLAVKYIMRVK
jgi:hypothetical protein